MSTVNLSSESACRRAYLNYHCQGNTMNISAVEMGRICGTWYDKLADWQRSVTADKNDYDFNYDFDDSAFINEKNEGYREARENTNCSGNTAGNWLRASGDGLFAAGSAVMGTMGTKILGQKAGEMVATKFIGKKAAGKFLEKATKKAAEKAGEKVASETTKEGAKKSLAKMASWSIAAPLALATAILYQVKKPNKKEYEAVMQLYKQYYPEATSELLEDQVKMEEIKEELDKKNDEANTANEEANAQIEEQKAYYDMYMKTFLNIQRKVDNGEQLTPEEQQIYNDVVSLMNEIAGDGGLIATITENTDADIADIYSEMEGYQSDYDSLLESMANIQGMTDFASGFDVATKTLCWLECAIQGLNAASGTQAAIKAGLALAGSLGFNWWAAACVGMGTAAAIMSGLGAKQQGQWAKEIGEAIKARKDLEGLNDGTVENYEIDIEGYESLMQGIEDLEIIEPENTNTVDASDVSGSSGDNSGDGAGVGAGTGDGSNSDGYNPFKKPDKK